MLQESPDLVEEHELVQTEVKFDEVAGPSGGNRRF